MRSKREVAIACQLSTCQAVAVPVPVPADSADTLTAVDPISVEVGYALVSIPGTLPFLAFVVFRQTLQALRQMRPTKPQHCRLFPANCAHRCRLFI